MESGGEGAGSWRDPGRGPGAFQPIGSEGPDAGDPWVFADRRRIVIVSSTLPDYLRAQIPGSSPTDPDFITSYKYSDLDALIELYGHIRAANPTSDVVIRTAEEIGRDDLISHLVLLGGIDWNDLTRQFLPLLKLPVHQTGRPGDDIGFFEVSDGQDLQEHHPAIEGSGSSVHLASDVALFYHGANPYNSGSSVFICNGIYSRGTYGVVRALTDPRFRQRNAAYIREQFAGRTAFVILCRVYISGPYTLTPDWTSGAQRLYVWPEPAQR